MKVRGAHIVVVMVVAMFIVACANIGTPDGGPFDETPPVIVSTSPRFLATNVKTQKVVLEFDENIRIDNAAEKVVVSPPQTEQPEINASGHKITITLLDTIKPDMTYTIDFADAIEDNNEGNPMGDYAFTFSTGDSIDTMQVSGYVLDASNLEPIKGIMVGLYEDLSTSSYLNHSTTNLSIVDDTSFVTKPFERISRTDSRGHFVIKGLARKKYMIYALQDQDQTFNYSQKSEMIAFTERSFVPYSRPDLRPDTVWHDSIHYDSIVLRPYTHFFPDDIVLLAFTPPTTDRFFLKAERPNLWMFTLYFTNKSDSLPTLEGLNFDASDAFLTESNETHDTIQYWIRDSLIYNLDTLRMAMRFEGTDTLGQLTVMSDTLELISKVSRAALEKQRQREYEEWVKDYRDQQKKARRRERTDSLVVNMSDTIPPLPEEFLDYRMSALSIDPIGNVDITMPEPLAVLDTALIHLYQRVDSLSEPRPYLIRSVDGSTMHYRLYAEWEPGATYEIAIDTAAMLSIYGKRCDASRRQVKVRGEDSYGYVRINLEAPIDTTHVYQLLNGSDNVVQSVRTTKDQPYVEFFYVQPSTYYLRMFVDNNMNGKWDTGDYPLTTLTLEQQLAAEPLFSHIAEAVYYYPGAIAVRAGWDVSQDWRPKATPIYLQKPAQITKQKADKQKTIKNRNAERNKNKRR